MKTEASTFKDSILRSRSTNPHELNTNQLLKLIEFHKTQSEQKVPLIILGRYRDSDIKDNSPSDFPKNEIWKGMPVRN